MTAGLAYIVEEYCTQSHLSTEHYGRAMQGLKQTRRFKKYTVLIRVIPDYIIKATKLLDRKTSGGKMRSGRRSLVWTFKAREHPLTIIPHSDNRSSLQKKANELNSNQAELEASKSRNQRQSWVEVNQAEISSPSSYATRTFDIKKGRS